MKNKIVNLLKVHILPVLVLTGIAIFIIACKGRFRTEFPVIKHEEGFADITDCDFENDVYHLENNWDRYYDVLYSPEDFLDLSKIPEKDIEKIGNPVKGTMRIRLLAKPHQWLALCSFSVDFGTRVFLNGEEVRNIGFVSDDPDEAVPKGRFMSIPMYSGETGKIEIIYQYSNYVHKEGGFVQSTCISTPENIDEFQRGMAVYSILISSGLLFLAFWFLLSASIQKSWEYAALAFCCFVLTFRNQFFFPEYLLNADYNFFWEYRVTVLSNALIPVSALFLLFAFFPKVVGKMTIYALTGFTVIMIALMWLLDTKESVTVSQFTYFGCIPFLLWSGFCIGRYILKSLRRASRSNEKGQNPEGSNDNAFDTAEALTLCAVILFMIILTFEGFYTGINSRITHFGSTPLVMVISVMMIAVAINHRIEKQLRSLESVKQKNHLLGQVNDMNKDFLRMVAHELKTPLTVISGYAQLTSLQLERSELSEKTPKRLDTIRSEANRLSEIVTKLMDFTYNNTKEVEMTAVDVNELLKSMSAVMTLVCAKNNNTLIINNTCAHKVRGNYELLLQVLINLIANASRHTLEGEITVEVKDSEQAEFYVKDTGSGILTEAVPHIFEKGYTTGNGNGIGLAICKDTIALHGGRIELVSTGPEGSVFRFTVPKWENKD